jgi:hypothetical protein
MNHYERRAKEDAGRGMVCLAGAAVMVTLCVVSAACLLAGWAVVCGCMAVFCWFGARVYFHDAAVNRRKARWRERPHDFPY